MLSKLRGLIRRSDKLATPTAPTTLFFRINDAAFAYACEFSDHAVLTRSEVVAVVTDVTGLHPDKPDFYALRLQSPQGEKEVIADIADPTAKFAVGDLVSFWHAGVTNQGGEALGLIAGKLLPELDPELGWKKA